MRFSPCATPTEQLKGAIVRLVLEYPREWDDLIDEAALRVALDYLSCWVRVYRL
jgi:hypothetical protein